MIIGNWLIAKAFYEYYNDNNILVFASWVSNSQNTDESEFKREIDLIHNTIIHNKTKLFVYISSCSISDETLVNSLYVKHKIQAENIIKTLCPEYLILRTSNPIWFTQNPNTIINFLYNKILTSEHFIVWKNAYRNLIDVEDLFIISKEIINMNIKNTTINVANTQYYSIWDIVNTLENIIWKKWNYELIEKWWTPKIDTSFIKSIISKLNIKFDNNYLNTLLSKYYKKW